jgi:hypothetical protein
MERGIESLVELVFCIKFWQKGNFRGFIDDVLITYL